MRKNKIKIVSTFGLTFVLTFLAMFPVVNADSPGTADVYVIRWDGEDFSDSIEEWLESDISNFSSDFESSSTPNDLYDVFQDYELVPNDKTLAQFESACEDVYDDNEDMIEENLSIYENETERPTGNLFIGLNVWMNGTIYAPMWSLFFPVFFYKFISPLNGGRIKYSANTAIEGPISATWFSNDYFDLFVATCVGLFLPKITQFITFWNIDYWAFAVYAQTFVGD